MSHVIARPATGDSPRPPRPPREPRLGRVLLLLTGVLALCLGAGTCLVAYALAWRTLPVVAALAGAVVAMWRLRGSARTIASVRAGALDDTDAMAARVLPSGIVGGVLGELLGYVVHGVPATAPASVGWWLVGAGGIGGAIGVAIGLYVMTARVIGPLVRETFALQRARRRPAA